MIRRKITLWQIWHLMNSAFWFSPLKLFGFVGKGKTLIIDCPFSLSLAQGFICRKHLLLLICKFAISKSKEQISKHLKFANYINLPVSQYRRCRHLRVDDKHKTELTTSYNIISPTSPRPTDFPWTRTPSLKAVPLTTKALTKDHKQQWQYPASLLPFLPPWEWA